MLLKGEIENYSAWEETKVPDRLTQPLRLGILHTTDVVEDTLTRDIGLKMAPIGARYVVLKRLLTMADGLL